MSWVLIRKEVRSLLPFIGLVMFFNLLSWGDLLLNHFPDQYPLSELLKETEDLILVLLVGFALAASLVVREADEGTLAFLDALPVSRTRVFMTKTVLALGVLWLMPLSDLVLRWVIYSWSRTSLETEFQWQPLLTRAVLDAFACVVCLAIGLALSFLRRFSFLALGLLVCAYLALVQLRVPYIQMFNIFSLSEPVFHGREWVFPTARLGIQLALATVCLAVAFIQFQWTGDSVQRLADRVGRRRGASVAGGLAIVLAGITWFALLVYWGSRYDEGQEKTEVRYAEWTTSRARTARFQFYYPENQAALARPLIDSADDVESEVRKFLGAKPIQTIVARLGGSAPRTAGVAHWKQVQIDLRRAGSSPEEIRAVFAHETTHVFIDHESQDRASDEFNSTRFFHEGLATYVEYHLFRPPERLGSMRRLAAVARLRHSIRLEELMDNDMLSRKYDPNLAYPLGEVFVDALVKRYGKEAPGRVLRAFGRSDAPKGLRGVELWRDLLHSWGANLSEVENLFYAELAQAIQEHDPFIQSLPRLRGIAGRQNDLGRLRPQHTGAAPGSIICRVRPSVDTPEWLYDDAWQDAEGLFRFNVEHFPNRVFWYQLGWRVPGSDIPVFEPWVEASLPE